MLSEEGNEERIRGYVIAVGRYLILSIASAAETVLLTRDQLGSIHESRAKKLMHSIFTASMYSSPAIWA
jgi:hypothetical protein